MPALSDLSRWLVQHPLTMATMLYALGVLAIMLYTYLEPRRER